MTLSPTETPVEEIRRQFPFEITRTDTRDGDGLTLEGYAAVFNSPTRIDSWEGTFDETIERGAFAKSISERTPVLQFDHGTHPMIGSIPLGSIRKLSEDDHGLFVRARLSDNWLIQPIRDAIADGAVDGMSFRFQVVRDVWDYSDDVDQRVLKEVAVRELGPVVFPAYEDTQVGVRSATLGKLLTDPKVLEDLARLLTFTTDAAPAGTSEDDTPPLEAPVSHKKRTEQALRVLRRSFPH